MQIKQATTLHLAYQRLRTFSRVVLLATGLALAACAGVGGDPPHEQVRRRSAERWQALISGEFSRAYTYNTPGFRAVVSLDSYRRRFGSAIVWQGSEVVDVKCPETTKCIAQLRIDYKPLLKWNIGDKISTHVEETWLFEGGQWWFFQDI